MRNSPTGMEFVYSRELEDRSWELGKNQEKHKAALFGGTGYVSTDFAFVFPISYLPSPNFGLIIALSALADQKHFRYGLVHKL